MKFKKADKVSMAYKFQWYVSNRSSLGMHFKVRGDRKNTRQVNEEMSLEAEKKSSKYFLNWFFFNMNVFLETQAETFLNAISSFPMTC
jgi:hypothetical protein